MLDLEAAKSVTNLLKLERTWTCPLKAVFGGSMYSILSRVAEMRILFWEDSLLGWAKVATLLHHFAVHKCNVPGATQEWILWGLDQVLCDSESLKLNQSDL